MYTFSAKEKDAETGYSYFGSRYYSSDLSIWLSVDPMSEKYPHQSNYVYCSNNPIKLIDPNGEDEWEIDKKGNINWVRESNTHRLYALDKNNKRTGEFITVNDRSSLVTTGTIQYVIKKMHSKFSNLELTIVMLNGLLLDTEQKEVEKNM